MIEKRYKDIDAGWFTPHQEEARAQLRHYYADIEQVIAHMKAGHPVQTVHAWYKWVPDEEDTDGR